MNVLKPRLRFNGPNALCSRMAELEKRHDPVALAVADRFVRDGHSAFISDGVTSFGVALHLFNNNARILLHTNNLAVALESCMWQDSAGPHDFDVVLPAGPVDERL